MLAEKKLKAIRVQIMKAQETNKGELAVNGSEVPHTRTEDNPDFALIKNDFLDTITRGQLPPHLITFLENVEIVPRKVTVQVAGTAPVTTEDAAQELQQ